MSYIIAKDQGVFNPTKRYAFTNITTEDFTSAWGGSPITVKKGQTIELNQHMANKLTNELVDKIIIGNAKFDEVEYYKNNPNTAPNVYRSSKGMSLGVPAARKVWEEKIVRELEVDEESPEIQLMRAQIKEEVMADMAKEKSSSPVSIPSSISEFAEITEGHKVEEVKPKKSIKVKEIKK